MSKMGEGLEGRTKLLSDDKFRALNKALKIDKKKPQGMAIIMTMEEHSVSIVVMFLLQRCR